MSKAEEIINEIRETSMWCEMFYRPIKKIKMKEEFYSQVAVEARELLTTAEVLDENKNPLNTLYGVKIEIDNSIEKDFEVVR